MPGYGPVSRVVIAGAIAAGAMAGGCEAPVQNAAVAPKVILIIGDGMDDQQITIARNYLAGYDGRLTLDDMPIRSAVQVQTVSESDPAEPIYVADSANSATTMATGALTSAGRIGTTAQTDQDLTSIMELAIARGFGTGIVTTSSVTDATPASFVAHIKQRYCEGPDDMVRENQRLPALSADCAVDYKANGGPGSIAEQIAVLPLDIVLGGGARLFAQPAEGADGKSVRDLAVANGFHVIGTAEELATLPPEGRVLGLFARGTMPVQWRGAGGAMAAPIPRVDGKLELPEPFSCEPNPDFVGPRLVDMARTALERLDGDRSFMLMIESASIDKQAHERRPCGHIGELAQLDETLALALDYRARHPETLVLVTADHGHAVALIPETSFYTVLDFASPGNFARIRTLEGAIMGVNYASNDSDLQEEHSGVQVPLLASGLVHRELPALIVQSDIFHIAMEHLGLPEPTLPPTK